MAKLPLISLKASSVTLLLLSAVLTMLSSLAMMLHSLRDPNTKTMIDISPKI